MAQLDLAVVEDLTELVALPNWVVWRFEPDPDRPKPRKMPYTPGSNRPAKANDAATWRPFAEAKAAYLAGGFDGLGFQFGSSGLVGVDLDHVRDPETGDILPAALDLVRALDSYTEASVSGTGLHILCRGALGGNGRRKADYFGPGTELECYDSGRYFVVTGAHIADTPCVIQERTPALAELYARAWPQMSTTTATPPPAPFTVTLDDQRVLDLLAKASNAPKFTRLWAGDLADYGGDQSRADLALCCTLAFYTQDPAQIDRLFRQSALYRPKWDQRHYGDGRTYGEATVQTALAQQTEHYTPRPRREPPTPAPALATEEGAAQDTPALWESADSAEAAYDLAADLAQLDAAEYAKAKATLKRRLGDALNLNDLDRAVNEARRKARRWIPALDLVIVTDRPLRDITADGVTALHKLNTPPALFVRSGKLARVRADEKGRPVIEEADESMLRGRLARVCDWARVTEAGERHCPPPLEVVRDILARGAWPFPALEAIAEAPCLRPDGSILETPGYDTQTQLVYWPGTDMRMPKVQTDPSGDDVRRALGLLAELTEGFPFVDDASRVNAWAFLLTPILRPAIAGKTPLSVISAPQAGTGKGLLAETAATIATGRPAAMMSAPRDDEEWRKHITSALMTGATMVTIDNCEGTLSAAPLAMALTAPVWTDRVLGRNETVHLPQRATWAATGNNLRLGGDLPRRCYWIRLDAQMAQPWQREGFRHPQLVTWATAQRGELLWSLLTLARAWYAAGQPAASVKPIGSFEDWCRVIGGVLENAGVKGFLGNLAEMYTRVDEEGPAWEGFLATWHETLGEQAVTVAELVGRMELGQPLRQALPDDLASAMDNPKADFSKRLGKALKARVDKRYGSEGLHLEQAQSDKRVKVARWRVAGFAGFRGVSHTRLLGNLPPFEGREDKGGGIDRESVEQTPRNPANPAGMGASVPVMVTSRMRRDLEAAGYTETDIDKMTPAEAWARLAVAGSVSSMAQASPATLGSGQSVEELI